MSKKKNEEFGKGVIEWVRIDDMVRDERVNPGLINERRAERIAAELDPDLFGLPTLWAREDGKYVIIDGQNRIEGLRRAGWNGQKLRCLVYHDITASQGAEIFLGLANTRNHHHFDRFAARVTAGDAVACSILKIAERAGYVIDRSGADGTIRATQALEDIYVGRGQRIKGHNPKALDDTLMVVTAAWGHVSHAVRGTVLKGVGLFFLRYENRVDTERLVKKLRVQSGGPEGLVLRGKGKKELHGGTVASGIGHYLTDVYNAGLRGARRLPGWREG